MKAIITPEKTIIEDIDGQNVADIIVGMAKNFLKPKEEKLVIRCHTVCSEIRIVGKKLEIVQEHSVKATYDISTATSIDVFQDVIRVFGKSTGVVDIPIS